MKTHHLYISLRYMFDNKCVTTIVLKHYCVCSACAHRKVKTKQFKQHVQPLLNSVNIENCSASHVVYANGACYYTFQRLFQTLIQLFVLRLRSTSKTFRDNMTS